MLLRPGSAPAIASVAQMPVDELQRAMGADAEPLADLLVRQAEAGIEHVGIVPARAVILPKTRACGAV
jgi:hypothetical protein